MSLGDAVISTVGFQMIRAAFPHAKITVLTLDATAPIYNPCKYIDELVTESAEIFWDERNLFKIALAIKKWRTRSYDLAVSFHVGKAPNFLVSLLRADIKVIPGRNKLKWLASPDGRSFKPGLNHYTQAYPEIAKAAIQIAGGINNGELPYAQIEYSERELLECDSSLSSYGLKGERYIAVFPGGGHNLGNQVVIKRYPKMAEALRLFTVKNRDVKIVLLGSATDKDSTEPIIKIIDNNRVIDLVGKTTIRQFAGIIYKSAMLVTTDSSALHVAQACNVPTVAIFGPTDPREFVDPRLNVRVIAPTKAKPVYTGKYFGNITDGLQTFDEISPEYVAEIIGNTWKEINEHSIT